MSRKQPENEPLRDLFSPAVILTCLVVLTEPFWVLPLTYAFLRTLLVAPTGLVIWVFVALLASYIVWSFGSWVLQLVWTVRSRKNLWQESPADDSACDEVESTARRRSSWKLATAFIGVQLLIPPMVALAMWQGMLAGPGPVDGNGKFRLATPREELARQLDVLERRGIFRPVWPGD